MGERVKFLRIQYVLEYLVEDERGNAMQTYTSEQPIVVMARDWPAHKVDVDGGRRAVVKMRQADKPRPANRAERRRQVKSRSKK